MKSYQDGIFSEHNIFDEHAKVNGTSKMEFDIGASYEGL